MFRLAESSLIYRDDSTKDIFSFSFVLAPPTVEKLYVCSLIVAIMLSLSVSVLFFDNIKFSILKLAGTFGITTSFKGTTC